MSQLTIYSDPAFIKRQERALRHLQVFCLVRSGNCALNEYWSPECQWHRAQIKLLRGLGVGVAWNMPYGWVQGQTSKTDCQNMASGDPSAQFPRAVLSAEASTHTASHFCSGSPCIHSQCLTGGCGVSSYTLSDVYQEGISGLGVDWLPFFSVSCRLTMICLYFKYGAMTSIVIIIACIKALEISHRSCT